LDGSESSKDQLDKEIKTQQEYLENLQPKLSSILQVNKISLVITFYPALVLNVCFKTVKIKLSGIPIRLA
jgi:hypothetical protein